MHRFIKLLTTNSLGILINVFSQILSVPLFLHAWGREVYGEWLVLTAVPNLLWSLEGGLGFVAANRMAIAASIDDWDSVNEIFQTTLLSQGLLSLLIFGGTLAFASCYQVANFFGFHRTTNPEASTILLIMMGYMLLGMLMSIYRGAYRASDVEVRSSMLQNTWRFWDLLVIVLVLLCHGDSVRLAECMFANVLFWVGLGCWDVNRKCNKIFFGVRLVSWPCLKDVVVHGLPLLMGQVATACYMQGYPLVVNRAFGPSMVVTLTTLRTMSRMGLLAVQTVAWTCSPQLSKSYGTQNWVLFGQFSKILALTAFWSGIAMTVGLSVLGPWLLTKWTGGKLVVDHSTAFIFALSVSLQGIWTCCLIALGACNKHHLLSYCYFVLTLVSLLIASLTTGIFGFGAIPVIMVVSDFVLVMLGLYICGKQISHFNLRALLCILQISFYERNLRKLLVQWKLVGAPVSSGADENTAISPGP